MYNSLYSGDPYNNAGLMTALKINNFNRRDIFFEHNNLYKAFTRSLVEDNFLFMCFEKVKCLSNVIPRYVMLFEKGISRCPSRKCVGRLNFEW